MGTVGGLLRIAARGVPAVLRATAATAIRPIGTALQGLPVGPIRTWNEDAETDQTLLHGEEVEVLGTDGVTLHAEIDPANVPDRQQLSVLFLHGYLENRHYWQYQRLALRGLVRSVYYDARGHGRSARGDQPITLEVLVDDLVAVLEAAVPEGPVILVGHSLGGMTVLALAARRPDLFVDRVVGVGLISTSATLADYDIGIRELGSAVWKRVPALIERSYRGDPRLGGLVERLRGLIGALEVEAIREIAFGPDVDPELLQFAAQMVGEARMDSSGDFLGVFGRLDVTEALAVMRGVEAIVICGDRDPVLPYEHSAAIARALPRALFSIVPNGAHLVSLQHPDVVNPHLFGLIQRVRLRLIVQQYAAREAREPR